MHKLGIIDLGSNSVRLVIYEICKMGSFKLIDDISEKVRLSENMVEGRFINDSAMRLAVKTISLFKNLCHAYNVVQKNIICVATEAVRKADNREYFLNLLYSATGLRFRVLTGEEEALYDYKAVYYSLQFENAYIIDIGGASTEIIRADSGKTAGYTSIPLGSVTASEKYSCRDVINENCIRDLENDMMEWLTKIGFIKYDNRYKIIGIGGTLRTLSKIHRRKTHYPLEITHNYEMKTEDFYSIYNELKSLDLKKRSRINGLSSSRADIITGGLAIFKALSDSTGAEKIIVSGNGLREGILYEYLFKTTPSLKFTDVHQFSLNNYMQFYMIRSEHSSHVLKICNMLFKQLNSIHRMGENENRILNTACLLHDIGINISFYDHYAHGFYMVLNSMLNGMSHKEIVMTALIVASHGSKNINYEFEGHYKKLLGKDDIENYHKLSVFLKIAECLDRSETGIIRSIECTIENRAVRLNTSTGGKDATLEKNLTREISPLFYKLFKRKLIVN